MGDKTEKKPSKTPLQKYKAEHQDKPCFYLGKKKDLRDEAIEDLGDLVTQVWHEIAKSNDREARFFLSSCRPAYLRLTQTAEIQPLTPPMLKSLLQNLVYFYHCTTAVGEDGESNTEYKTRSAPNFIIAQMLNNPLYQFPLPELERVVTAPYFTRQRQLHAAPGYLAASKTYYHLTDARLQGVTVPSAPNAAQVQEARNLILDVLVDFPFSGDAERANAIAAMLEPFIRAWFHATPFRLIESPVAGTGKGMLADALMYPFLGRMINRHTEARTPDAWQKLITTILLQMPAVVFFDNIKKPVNDGHLESILTDPEWSDRMLGGNQGVHLLNQATWLFAGNNVQLGQEIARRTVRIRIVFPRANPHQRRNYVHPLLRDWLIANRKPIVTAILTLIQHWLSKGQPTYDNAPTLGSFEQWAEIMHGILTVNDIPGFLGNLQEMIDLDKYDWDNITEVIQALWLLHHDTTIFSTKDVFGVVEADESLPIYLGQGDARAKSTKLGIILNRNREKVFIVSEACQIEGIPVTVVNEVQFLTAGKANNANLYRLVKVSERWEAEKLTPEQTDRLPKLYAAVREAAKKNQQLLPEDLVIKPTQPTPPNTAAENDNNPFLP